ncbi:MAG: LamG domain-containing protein [Planctomycetota bacterium]
MLQHTGRFVSLLWVVGVMAGTWFAAPAVYAGAPSVNCPGNLFISLNPGCSSVLADYTGSASGGTATQSPPAGSVVTAPGLVAVTITVTDSMGSLPPAQCTFNITFVDDTPPVLICGPLPDINVPAGQSGALVVLTTPTASDACGGAVQVFLDDGNGPISTQGDYFATLGQNILSWGATDTAGNTSFCSQSFSVIPPVPANDDVCSALPLVADALTPFHLIGATPQAGEVTPGEGTDGSSCDSQDGWCSFETTVNNSIWFTFVAPSTGCVSIETINGQGPTDSQLAVYAVGDCNDFSTFTEVAANDDGGEGVAALIDELNGLVPGSTYYVQVDGFGGSQVVADILLTVCVPPRVTDCLLVYYDFCDGQGDIVHDTSGEVPAIDLTIADPANVTWLPGSGLSVDTPTVISSITPATRVIDACVAAEELTIEAWVQPGNDTQAGPARIVALSENGFPGGGNAVLGQEAGDYRTRARTTTTLQYGKPELSGPAVDTGAVQHVVFTRNAAGMEHLYVDGVLVDSQEKLGDMLTVWGTSYPLALANEPAPTIPGGFFRPWLGNLHLVAMYKKALSTSEVFQNYAAGFVFAPTITSQPEDVFTPPGFPATFSVVATGS